MISKLLETAILTL
jgi:hypothetical protein